MFRRASRIGPPRRSIADHAVRIAGSANASSLDHIAAMARAAASAREPRIHAAAAATAKSVTSKAVRPLIHNTAMLMP